MYIAMLTLNNSNPLVHWVMHQIVVKMCLEIITKYLGFIRPPEGLNCHIETLQQHLSPDIILIHKGLVDGLDFFLQKRQCMYN